MNGNSKYGLEALRLKASNKQKQQLMPPLPFFENTA
jgi:hypothetical protein